MKKHAFWVLPIAAAFALSGCAGSENASTGGTENSGNTGGSTAEQEQSTGSAALTAEQASAVVTTLAGGDAKAQVISGDEIKDSLPSSEELLSGMTIEPEKCAELMTQQGSMDLDGTNVAVAVVPGEGTEIITYSVAGYEGSAKIDEAKTLMDKKDLRGCDKFSMSISGQKMSAEAKILDAESDADSTMITQTNVSVNGTAVPGGSYQAQGLVGSNAVVVSYSGISGEESESAMVEKLVGELNKAVAEVKSASK